MTTLEKLQAAQAKVEEAVKLIEAPTTACSLIARASCS
jgi:hypothetical protein